MYDGFLADPEVDFSHPNNSPPDLPGGNNADPDFETSAGFSADEDTGQDVAASVTDKSRLDVGEHLGIVFDLKSGQTITDLLASLDPANFVIDPNSAAPDGFLRLGVHAQGLPGGASDSFVSTYSSQSPPPPPPPPPDPGGSPGIAPEPASVILLGAGLLVIGRRRSRWQ